MSEAPPAHQRIRCDAGLRLDIGLGLHPAPRQHVGRESHLAGRFDDMAGGVRRTFLQPMIDGQHDGRGKGGRCRPFGKKQHQGDRIAAPRNRHGTRPGCALGQTMRHRCGKLPHKCAGQRSRRQRRQPPALRTASASLTTVFEAPGYLLPSAASAVQPSCFWFMARSDCPSFSMLSGARGLDGDFFQFSSCESARGRGIILLHIGDIAHPIDRLGRQGIFLIGVRETAEGAARLVILRLRQQVHRRIELAARIDARHLPRGARRCDGLRQIIERILRQGAEHARRRCQMGNARGWCRLRRRCRRRHVLGGIARDRRGVARR